MFFWNYFRAFVFVFLEKQICLFFGLKRKRKREKNFVYNSENQKRLKKIKKKILKYEREWKLEGLKWILMDFSIGFWREGEKLPASVLREPVKRFFLLCLSEERPTFVFFFFSLLFLHLCHLCQQLNWTPLCRRRRWRRRHRCRRWSHRQHFWHEEKTLNNRFKQFFAMFSLPLSSYLSSFFFWFFCYFRCKILALFSSCLSAWQS